MLNVNKMLQILIEFFIEFIAEIRVAISKVNTLRINILAIKKI